ncbi:ATP-binding protein [Anaerospora hongkongensis]|uniref:ATP-binding protein n=1 Tax=Anaerospora hongkongensis TaxID=244830 RepID=UPI00289A2648|nr:ATP-binding protein [Anaerospora hongkongensis]
MRFKSSLTAKFMLGIATITVILMSINLLWNIRQYNLQAESEMKEKAAVLAQQLIATRAFIALKQDDINKDSGGGYEFKHLNPAAVGKGIGDIFNGYSGYRLKQTRMLSRDPGNAPDNFEVDALKQLAADQGLKELWGYHEVDGTRVFRYLVPLYYDDSCLSCHGKPAGEIDVAGFAKEGFSAGEFAGAISVVFPLALFEAAQRNNVMSQIIFIVFMVFANIGLTYLMMEHIVMIPIRELTHKVVALGKGDLSAQITDVQTYDEMRLLANEFNTMASKLNQFYFNLEDKVGERTRMLSEANRQLAIQGQKLKAMNEKLTETDRLKSEFLTVMSHELRTPLTAIIAFAEILLDEGQSLSSLQREYLQDIFESGHQLLDQINDILNMSKIEAGLIKLNCTEVDIREIVISLLRNVTPLAHKKGLLLRTEFAEAIPLVLADREKLMHVLRNLISNALKFTPAQGKITISAALEEQLNLPVIKVAVKDTGIGISLADQAYIFEKFRQVDSAETRGYPGSGLGLALARNLIELHGGRLWVESELGQGSLFIFTLPVTAKGC